jgi:hypothetical protein
MPGQTTVISPSNIAAKPRITNDHQFFTSITDTVLLSDLSFSTRGAKQSRPPAHLVKPDRVDT